MTGEVRSINVRSTIVTTNDNVDIVVPSLQFISGDWEIETALRKYGIEIPYHSAIGACGAISRSF